MGIILWIVFGGLVGWIASFIMNTDREQGLLANIVVGIIGSVLGNFIARFFGESGGGDGFTVSNFLVSVLGAIVLIFVVRALRPKNRNLNQNL